MRRALSLYQYLAPAVLAPLSLWLWWRHYQGHPQALALTALAWGLPVAWAYVVPAVGTNVLKVWEFDVRLRLGRFRPHHGFVFGSATASLAWLVQGPLAAGWLDVLRAALVLASVLGFWNLLYEVAALKSGLLKVYTQPWADGQPAETIAHDYAPWFFGGFGAVYGAVLGLAEWQTGWLARPAMALAYFGCALALACALPSAGFIWQSRRRHGHWGTRPVAPRTHHEKTQR
ncbi:MAG: hypothetical protein Q4G70_10165 [Pseudomonadota bacterium]|nr:hypothetical protein [Pseudomonadota bacterium]